VGYHPMSGPEFKALSGSEAEITPEEMADYP
jgi:hypothetical protein